MNSNYDFCLTPAYCLYNGAAVLEQNGAYIKFLVEDKSNTLLCGRLSRAFENHVANVRHFKDCPETFQRLIKIDFVNGSRSQVKKCLLKLYKATDTDSLSDAKLAAEQNEREAAAVILLDSILNEARLRKASDIHIEKNCVRLRINGLLEEMMELQHEKSLELIQRIKLLAGMNVIENRKCQDGSFIYGNKNPFSYACLPCLQLETLFLVGSLLLFVFLIRQGFLFLSVGLDLIVFSLKSLPGKRAYVLPPMV